jgi:ribosomal protein S18 acetylase RimI-like enzyme
MRVDVIAVPYDSGLRMEGMGCGPARLLEGGLAARLADDGHEVVVTTLETRCSFRVEAAVAVDLQKQVAESVGRAAVAILQNEVWIPPVRITLEVLAHNTGAKTFWQAVGFRDYAVGMELVPERAG